MKVNEREREGGREKERRNHLSAGPSEISRIKRWQNQVTDELPSNSESLQLGAEGEAVAVKPLISPFYPLG